MKTRLRSQRRREDEPLPPARTPEPGSHVPQRQTALLSLQRTLGNTAMRRYLTGEQSAAQFISRDTAKETVEQNAPAKSRKATFFMTITDEKGKPIRGPSKRKGHEGQFELSSFNVFGPQAGVNGNGSGGPSRETKHDGDTTTVTSKELVSFQFVKPIDDASATLVDMVASGHHCTMHIEMVVTEVDGKESAALTVDMKEVLLTGYQPAGTDNSKERIPLEVIGAETIGMVTVVHALAEKAEADGQKKPTIELRKQK